MKKVTVFIFGVALSTMAFAVNSNDQVFNDLTISKMFTYLKTDTAYLTVLLKHRTLDQEFSKAAIAQNENLKPEDFKPFWSQSDSEPLNYREIVIVDNVFYQIHYVGDMIYDSFRTIIGDTASVPWGYCEQHSNDAPFCKGSYANALYAFIVRSVANPVFVEAACEPMISFYGQSMKLSNADTAENKQLLKLSLDRLDQAMAYLENGGEWKVDSEFMKHLSDSGLSDDMNTLLKRRHFDSGPVLWTALRSCLGKARTQLAE
jgi:hypothetical protein